MIVEPSLITSMLKAQGDKGYWYIATPYSKYRAGLEKAFEDASMISAVLVLAGVRLYCPIAHTHPIAVYGNIPPRNHDIWLPLDKPFMEAASGLLVVKMQGWDESYGIGVEIESFKSQCKPILYTDFTK